MDNLTDKEKLEILQKYGESNNNAESHINTTLADDDEMLILEKYGDIETPSTLQEISYLNLTTSHKKSRKLTINNSPVISYLNLTEPSNTCYVINEKSKLNLLLENIGIRLINCKVNKKENKSYNYCGIIPYRYNYNKLELMVSYVNNKFQYIYKIRELRDINISYSAVKLCYELFKEEIDIMQIYNICVEGKKIYYKNSVFFLIDNLELDTRFIDLNHTLIWISYDELIKNNITNDMEKILPIKLITKNLNK